MEKFIDGINSVGSRTKNPSVALLSVFTNFAPTIFYQFLNQLLLNVQFLKTKILPCLFVLKYSHDILFFLENFTFRLSEKLTSISCYSLNFKTFIISTILCGFLETTC